MSVTALDSCEQTLPSLDRVRDLLADRSLPPAWASDCRAVIDAADGLVDEPTARALLGLFAGHYLRVAPYQDALATFKALGDGPAAVLALLRSAAVDGRPPLHSVVTLAMCDAVAGVVIRHR